MPNLVRDKRIMEQQIDNFEVANKYFNLKEYELAIKHYDKVILKNPAAFSSYLNKGNACVCLFDYITCIFHAFGIGGSILSGSTMRQKLIQYIITVIHPQNLRSYAYAK